MSQVEPDIQAYNAALVKALRSTDPRQLRQFAATWGGALANRGLKQLAKASDAVVERRLWQMIYDRPDLADLQERAEGWLASHPSEPIPPV
ncbi:MAG TPA: hypothetical protein VIO35_04505 [Chloroflexota bacterium]|jgi:hypothetical protein